MADSYQHGGVERVSVDRALRKKRVHLGGYCAMAPASLATSRFDVAVNDVMALVLFCDFTAQEMVLIMPDLWADILNETGKLRSKVFEGMKCFFIGLIKSSKC